MGSRSVRRYAEDIRAGKQSEDRSKTFKQRCAILVRRGYGVLFEALTWDVHES